MSLPPGSSLSTPPIFYKDKLRNKLFSLPVVPIHSAYHLPHHQQHQFFWISLFIRVYCLTWLTVDVRGGCMADQRSYWNPSFLDWRLHTIGLYACVILVVMEKRSPFCPYYPFVPLLTSSQIPLSANSGLICIHFLLIEYSNSFLYSLESSACMHLERMNGTRPRPAGLI